jgi:hypothetical protein
MATPNKPRVGDALLYKGAAFGLISRVEGNLCWYSRLGDDEGEGLFIWRFKDGLNKLFDWPTKETP